MSLKQLKNTALCVDVTENFIKIGLMLFLRTLWLLGNLK